MNGQLTSPLSLTEDQGKVEKVSRLAPPSPPLSHSTVVGKYAREKKEEEEAILGRERGFEGQVIYRYANGNSIEVYGDGKRTYRDGKTRTEKTVYPDGTEDIQYADGTRQRKKPDGLLMTRHPDGTVRTERFL